MVVALLLMTSICRFSQAASLPGGRDRYCTEVLGQTIDQEKNCEGAPFKYTNARRSSLDLLCCLGFFSLMPVKVNYTSYLDMSMIAYINSRIQSDYEEKQIAMFIKECYDQPGRRLNEEDYDNWKRDPSPSKCKAVS